MASVMSTHATIRAERAEDETPWKYDGMIWLGGWRMLGGFYRRTYLDPRWGEVDVEVLRPCTCTACVPMITARPLIAAPRRTR